MKIRKIASTVIPFARFILCNQDFLCFKDTAKMIVLFSTPSAKLSML